LDIQPFTGGKSARGGVLLSDSKGDFGYQILWKWLIRSQTAQGGKSSCRCMTDLMDFLNQRDRDYCIGNISSRWFVTGMNVCGAGGRYPSAECGLIVL
jgi:hypothetical protein